MNRKGFTLVELLAVIAIIGLAIGGSVFGIIKLIKESENKGSNITISSIETSASAYATEKNDDEDYWQEIVRKGYEGKYFCVTIEELMNKGLLEKNINFNKLENVSKTTYVGVRKDNITQVNSKPTLLNDINLDNFNYSDTLSEKEKIYGVCTGNIINEVLTKLPTLEGSTSYTDEINDIVFTNVEGNNVVIKETTCEYGKTSGNLNKKVIPEGNKCNLSDLEDNKIYYIRVCNTTEAGSTGCSETETRSTLDVKPPSITLSDKVNITYNTDNIKGESYYYFKSTISGTSSINVSSCTLNDNTFTCNNDSTTSITKDTWYKSPETNISISYSTSGTGEVEARTYDKSNNYNENSKEFSIYKITFNKGDADKIGGVASNVDKLCLAEKDGSCNITSPSIEKAGYTAVGWNTDSSASTSTWNVGVSKSINSDGSYYPITKISVYTLKYDTQGGTTIASQTANAGSSVTVTTTIPTKTGNKFTNWNTEKDGTGTTYESGSTVVLNSNITLYAIWSYSVPIISCNNVYPDDEYAYSATNGSVRVKVTDDDGDLDKIYYNKSYYDPFDYNTTNSTFYITDAKTNMIRIYALDKLGHISSNQMPEWSSPTGENGIVYCYTNLDLAAPNTPLVSLLKNDDGSWNLSEMTNIKDIETDCCYKKAYEYPNCHSASIDRNVTEDQSCTITAYRTNPSRYAELKFYFFGEDWFGNYIKETGDMFEARKITGISGEDYYYMTEYNSSGRTCSKKCSYTNASNCSCMSNAVKNEIYLVDKVGHKSKTLTINIVWK